MTMCLKELEKQEKISRRRNGQIPGHKKTAKIES